MSGCVPGVVSGAQLVESCWSSMAPVPAAQYWDEFSGLKLPAAPTPSTLTRTVNSAVTGMMASRTMASGGGILSSPRPACVAFLFLDPLTAVLRLGDRSLRYKPSTRRLGGS